jgi:nucleotide-binding universal stress UspA family protein
MSQEDPGGSGLAIREPPKVLVPVKVLEGQTVPEPLIEFLAPSDVVVLGYHVIPEQTATEQASMQFEDRAREAVADIAAGFEAAGRGVERRVAFTHDRDQTIARVAEEVGATAVLLPNPVGDVEDVLVAVRGAIDVDRLADLVATLLAEGDQRVTLWGLGNGTADFDAEAAVERARETLRDRGLAGTRVTAETTASDAPVRDVVERSGEFDVIVMGEGGPTLLSLLLGDAPERVAEETVAPVLVVRPRPDRG